MTPLPLLLVLLVSFPSFYFEKTSASISNEMQQLLAFKGKLSKPSHLDNWNITQGVCSFRGVSCKKSRVSAVDLSFIPLKLDFHVVASLLMSLERLERLSLPFAHLTGNLSRSSSCSGYLKFLDLSGNKLHAHKSSLGSCLNLKSLNLSNNQISGRLPFFSSKTFWNLPKLEVVDLSSNYLNGSIAKGLCEHSSLRELYLQNNLFTGSIPPTLGNCSQLVSLDISFNYLTGVIPPQLGSLPYLRDLILWMNVLEGEIPTEITKVQTLEILILDYNGLTGSIPLNLSNCTRMTWISLSSNCLSGEIPRSIGQLDKLEFLNLGNNSFSGSIPPELGDCRSLFWLDLNSNLLSGSIPSILSRQSGHISFEIVRGKRYAYVRNKVISGCHGAGFFLESSGIRLDALHRLPTTRFCTSNVYMGNTESYALKNGSMVFLDLSHNHLEGGIPKELGGMLNLSVLDLRDNRLSGMIPDELGNIKHIGNLYLSNNQLEGPIPSSFSGMTFLTEIDFSNNKLYGPIPEAGQFTTFPPYRYENNTGLCGYPMPVCRHSSSNTTTLPHLKYHHRLLPVAGWIAIGIGILLCCLSVCVCFYCLIKRSRRKKAEVTLEICIGDRSHFSAANPCINLATSVPRIKLTSAELLEATNCFHNDNLIGLGGFGKVYKAVLKDGTIVAVKKLFCSSDVAEKEFRAEVETIGKIRHPNLVSLLAYFKVGEDRLLVYEYIQFGSLEDVLHGRKRQGITFNWEVRKKIAIGTARGLAFLHQNCVPHILHRDIKPSNILIGENMEAKISDFGMARLMSSMDTHLSVTTLEGTPGYIPPEYGQRFRCSCEGDVYSFGMVLLELVTGRRVSDPMYADTNLAGWVTEMLKSSGSSVVDQELAMEGPQVQEEIKKYLDVACSCVDSCPARRPTMVHIVAMFGGGRDRSLFMLE